MNVPDGLVFASVPVLLGASAKAAQWFVQDVIARNKKTSRSDAAIDRPAADIGLTQFDRIGELLKRELNGRYMFAAEARDKFADLEKQIDRHTQEIKAVIELRVCPKNSG